MCELGEYVLEGGRIGATHAWGDEHPRENDLAGGITVADGIDDRLEIVAGTVDGDTAEAVVGAEFEDKDVDRLAQCPAEAALTAGAGFAADAGVDNLIGQMEGVEAAADEGWEGLLGTEAISSGDAVAKKDDGLSGVGGG